MSPKLIIKSHHPWRHRLRIGLIVCLVLALGWWLMQYSRTQVVVDVVELEAQHIELEKRLQDSHQANKKLTERIAILERATQVDKQAYTQVESSLKQAQDEMLELKEQLAFYRGILSPSESSTGLDIADFRITGIGELHAYRFKLVLTQVKSNDRVVIGYARIQFEGVQNGSQVRLDLKDVSGGRLDRLKLRFKFFQNNEGEFVLPADFAPSRVVVDVVPTIKGLDRFKKTFDWSDIIKQSGS